jgi:hypothetical protein
MKDIEQIKAQLLIAIQLIDRNILTTTNIDLYNMSETLEDMVESLESIDDFVDESEED